MAKDDFHAVRKASHGGALPGRGSARGFCLRQLCMGLYVPPLTGRIVDAANIIPPAVAGKITPKLASLESKSGIQLVVATVKSLEGDEIEPYANALFRAWGLGEKQKNNGVLLLVAPNEHKVRVEVGYALKAL